MRRGSRRTDAPIALVLPEMFAREVRPTRSPAQVRDQVLAEVERHVNQVRARFSADAAACIAQQLRQHGPRSGEQLVDGCKAAGIVPHDDRAFGPVFQRLARQRVMHIVGTTARAKGHAAPGCRIWALVEASPC